MPTKPRGKDHPFFLEGNNVPEVIAHRGGAGEFPGETIYAFEQAVKLGVDVLEMDIRYTRDEVLVLMHNSNVLETTGVDQRIKDIDSRHLVFKPEKSKEFDAAFWWKIKGKGFPPGAMLGVPSLEEVFSRFSGMRMNIEIKPFLFPTRMLELLYKLIRDYEMTDKVLIASAYDRHLYVLRCLYPELATSASVLEMMCYRVLKNLRYKPTTDAIQLSSRAGPFHFITQKYVDKVHSIGLKVHGWTVNHPEEMGRLISLGIDGIITDYPTTLMELLGRKRVGTPVP